MRKLTVKNFSVIKEAELEFGKITVLIGPQSSGKSLLCKLAYFLGPILSDMSATFAAHDQSWEQFTEHAKSEFRLWFPPYAWRNSTFSIRYEEGLYGTSVHASEVNGENVVNFSFAEPFRKLYQDGNSSIHASTQLHEDMSARSMRMSFRWLNFLHALNVLQGRNKVESSAYVPAGRSFFSNLNNFFGFFKNEKLDPILKEFAENLDWKNTAAGIPLSALKQELLSAIEAIQGGRFILKDGSAMFEDNKGIRLPLGMVSSGTQELVPLFRILSTLILESNAISGNNGPERIREYFLIVEEPESHIFPSTQNELVKMFSRLSNESWFSFSWAITTHSPYLLSAFNDLLKAGQVARERPERAVEVEKIIPRHYWISPGDIRAYAFNGKDAILRSMIDPDTGLIDGDTLDDVSSTIGKEFEDLLEIQYGS